MIFVQKEPIRYNSNQYKLNYSNAILGRHPSTHYTAISFTICRNSQVEGLRAAP